MKLINAHGNKVAHAALLCAFASALFSVSSPSNAASTTLTISGRPPASVAVAGHYSFQWTVKDTVRSRIKFEIHNKPAWASFDPTTGRLWGQPNYREVGTYSDIKVTVIDWYGFVTTAPFSITVVKATPTPPVTPPVAVNRPPAPPAPPAPSASNTVLDWIPPTENTDGSVLSNLAGYVVHYGTTPTGLTNTIKLNNPGLTSYVVDNLATGTWYFSVSSYTAAGVESSQSGVISTKIL